MKFIKKMLLRVLRKLAGPVPVPIFVTRQGDQITLGVYTYAEGPEFVEMLKQIASELEITNISVGEHTFDFQVNINKAFLLLTMLVEKLHAEYYKPQIIVVEMRT